jgi:CelD/BcsL family acetyltransferase involved in cellulose biosynthesis
VEFDVVHPDVDTLTPLLEDFFRIEASGWKGRAGTAALLHPRVHRFYCDYARSAARQGMLRFFFLKIDGKTVAARMALEYGKRLWDLKIAYDEAYRECVPGILLTHETLRYSLERGLEAQEFLGQAEAWERHWPCEEDEYVSMRVYPFSLTGQLSLAQDVYQLALREVPNAAQEHLRGMRRKASSGIGAFASFPLGPGSRAGRGNLPS